MAVSSFFLCECPADPDSGDEGDAGAAEADDEAAALRNGLCAALGEGGGGASCPVGVGRLTPPLDDRGAAGDEADTAAAAAPGADAAAFAVEDEACAFEDDAFADAARGLGLLDFPGAQLRSWLRLFRFFEPGGEMRSSSSPSSLK